MPIPVSHSLASDTRFLDRWEPLSATGSRDETRLHALVKQLATGDRAALTALYKLTVPLLFSVARRVLPVAADVEEVMCDVYTQVWQTAAQYDVTRGSVKTWLAMICRSRAIDRHRQNDSRSLGEICDTGKRADPFAPSFALDDLLDALQRGTAVHGAFEQLSPLRRRLLALAFFHGLTHHEIAVTTDLPLGTVKSHIRRALATLRKTLEPESDLPQITSVGIQNSPNPVARLRMRAGAVLAQFLS